MWKILFHFLWRHGGITFAVSGWSTDRDAEPPGVRGRSMSASTLTSRFTTTLTYMWATLTYGPTRHWAGIRVPNHFLRRPVISFRKRAGIRLLAATLEKHRTRVTDKWGRDSRAQVLSVGCIKCNRRHNRQSALQPASAGQVDIVKKIWSGTHARRVHQVHGPGHVVSWVSSL